MIINITKRMKVFNRAAYMHVFYGQFHGVTQSTKFRKMVP